MRDMNYAPAEGMQPNAPTLHSTATTLLLRVKGGRTHNEQIFSAQPLGADFVRRSLHFACGPQAAVSTRNKSLAPIPGSWPGKVTEYSRP
jgi:hypothetical protein